MLSDPSSRRRLVLTVSVGIVLIVLIGLGAYGLFAGPGEPPDDTSDDEVAIANRREDFLRFVSNDVQRPEGAPFRR